ncbi:4438_t:CDS:2 [Acaulospora colombiana]|uniref:4438_t:CDS:1 n=1 Tax=Acaulospora colombiana TaxID=27376 RepID=A0ACA9NVN4_9GLOM|nr:4438_t:CDS:2 [Acaulospora colombiana]
MSKQNHSTTQAFEEHPDTISPGPKDGEHPQDLRSRPNDARNDHQAAESGLNDVEYPPQLHAGKVGLGPHYAEQNRPTVGEQFQGIKETLKGKITHNPQLEETGHERITGELKRREREKGDQNPFANKDEDDKQEQSPDNKNDVNAQ